MMCRLKGLFLVLALASANLASTSAALAQSQEEEAGDVSEVDKDATGPLRDRIRPVSGHVFLKGGRFELSPSAAVSIKDAFFTKYMFGATAAYHFSDEFALGLRFNYAIPIVSGAAQICNTDSSGLNLTCRSPTNEELSGNGPGKLNMMGGLDFYWAPIYGKISLTSEAFIHFDMYVVVGPQAILYTGPATGAPLDTNGFTVTDSKFTVGANLGIGLRIFTNRWFALRTELRDLSYFEQVGAANTNTWRNQFMFELGFSFFVPPNFSER